MEDQLGSLGQGLNAVVQLRTEGHEIPDENAARLSLLKYKNLNLLGCYSITATQPDGGTMRPLSDPDSTARKTVRY